ncbi:MAG TPA: hypothetical protein VKY15_01585 [Acidimicrobiales bacterium]|nr:hypothetical protein [Acidimicrobiales bacterium]
MPADAGPGIPSHPAIALGVAMALVLATYPLAHRVATRVGDRRLADVLLAALVVHLLAVPVLIFVDDHVYHGVTDYTGYDLHGAVLAGRIRHLDFSLSGSGVDGIVGDGAVSIATGVVFALVGVDQLAGFLVFSWLSFLGLVCFYLAFATTFPEAPTRRYAWLVMFLPSLVYWPSAVGKEALMMLSVGVASYGAARILAGSGGGVRWLVAGGAIGAGVRPNELLLLVAALAAAFAIQAPRRLAALRISHTLGVLALVGAGLAVSIALTIRFLHGNGNSFASVLQTVHANNTNGSGPGFGSSNVPYSSSPAAFPRDLYTVLFDPTVFQARSATQAIAAAENSVILLLVVASWRRLRLVPRAMVRRPFVALAAVYSAGFVYVFAALGNLGLIERERTLLLPMLLVLVCIPTSPDAALPWERAGRDRREASHPEVAQLLRPAGPATSRRSA